LWIMRIFKMEAKKVEHHDMEKEEDNNIEEEY
jgi:hypothetical protein